MPLSEFAQVSRRMAGDEETAAANRSWWDAEAGEYYTEHGAFLGDSEFIWGPEGWQESNSDSSARWPAAGCWRSAPGRASARAGSPARVRWSWPRTSRSACSERGHPQPEGERLPAVPLLQCDALELPFPDGAFDAVFTSYGAVPFVSDSVGLVREAARVLPRVAASCSRPPTRSAGRSPTTRAPAA